MKMNERNKKFIITVDVETGELTEPTANNFDTLVRDPVLRFAEKLGRHGLKATFFMNVYESFVYGLEPWRSLCKKVSDLSYEVGLHTHPRYFHSSKKKNMWEYSLCQQVSIIQIGKDMLEQFTEQKVASHRAGNYGADIDTLTALRWNDITIDSSLYRGFPECRLSYLANDKPFKWFGVTEIPITVRPIKQQFPSIPLLRKVWLRRIDLKEARDTDFSQLPNPIIITGHSFDMPPSQELDLLLNHISQIGECKELKEIAN